MHTIADNAVARALQDAAHRLTGSAADFDPVLALVGDARATEMGRSGELNVAVEPLERTPMRDRGELPETYPTAL